NRVVEHAVQTHDFEGCRPRGMISVWGSRNRRPGLAGAGVSSVSSIASASRACYHTHVPRQEVEAMSPLISDRFETVAPTEADAVLARESSRRLAKHKLGRRSSVRIQLVDGGKEAETV